MANAKMTEVYIIKADTFCGDSYTRVCRSKPTTETWIKFFDIFLDIEFHPKTQEEILDDLERTANQSVHGLGWASTNDYGTAFWAEKHEVME